MLLFLCVTFLTKFVEEAYTNFFEFYIDIPPFFYYTMMMVRTVIFYVVLCDGDAYQIYAVKESMEHILVSNMNGFVFHTTGLGRL